LPLSRSGAFRAALSPLPAAAVHQEAARALQKETPSRRSHVDDAPNNDKDAASSRAPDPRDGVAEITVLPVQESSSP